MSSHLELDLLFSQNRFIICGFSGLQLTIALNYNYILPFVCKSLERLDCLEFVSVENKNYRDHVLNVKTADTWSPRLQLQLREIDK